MAPAPKRKKSPPPKYWPPSIPSNEELTGEIESHYYRLSPSSPRAPAPFPPKRRSHFSSLVHIRADPIIFLNRLQNVVMREDDLWELNIQERKEVGEWFKGIEGVVQGAKERRVQEEKEWAKENLRRMEEHAEGMECERRLEICRNWLGELWHHGQRRDLGLMRVVVGEIGRVEWVFENEDEKEGKEKSDEGKGKERSVDEGIEVEGKVVECKVESSDDKTKRLLEECKVWIRAVLRVSGEGDEEMLKRVLEDVREAGWVEVEDHGWWDDLEGNDGEGGGDYYFSGGEDEEEEERGDGLEGERPEVDLVGYDCEEDGIEEEGRWEGGNWLEGEGSESRDVIEGSDQW